MLEKLVGKGLTLAGLLYGSLNLFGCAEENNLQKPELGEYEELKTNNYVFTPSDSNYVNKSIIKEYPIYSTSVGLDLNGTVLGFNIENKRSMQTFAVSQKSHILKGVALPFGGLKNSTLASYVYSNGTIKQLTLSFKTYSKDDFEFLGADWRYGFGGGIKLGFNSRQVMLIDSSLANSLQEVLFYPSLSSFVEIHTDKSKSYGIKFIFDLEVTSPSALQLFIMFSSDLKDVIRSTEENN